MKLTLFFIKFTSFFIKLTSFFIKLTSFCNMFYAWQQSLIYLYEAYQSLVYIALVKPNLTLVCFGLNFGLFRKFRPKVDRSLDQSRPKLVWVRLWLWLRPTSIGFVLLKLSKQSWPPGLRLQGFSFAPHSKVFKPDFAHAYRKLKHLWILMLVRLGPR